MANGCTHFISMDADEYYFLDQLKHCREIITSDGFDATACRCVPTRMNAQYCNLYEQICYCFYCIRMRTYFKEASYELLPVDSMNAVPFIYKISSESPFRIAAEYLPVNYTFNWQLSCKSHAFSSFNLNDIPCAA